MEEKCLAKSVGSETSQLSTGNLSGGLLPEALKYVREKIAHYSNIFMTGE